MTKHLFGLRNKTIHTIILILLINLSCNNANRNQEHLTLSDKVIDVWNYQTNVILTYHYITEKYNNIFSQAKRIMSKYRQGILKKTNFLPLEKEIEIYIIDGISYDEFHPNLIIWLPINKKIFTYDGYLYCDTIDLSVNKECQLLSEFKRKWRFDRDCPGRADKFLNKVHVSYGR